MTSLVLELQRDAIDNQTSITNLLRRALVVATKLSQSDFRFWVSCELDGYPNGSEIPNYRQISGEIRAWNNVRGEWIPCIYPPETTKQLSRRNCAQRISEIENLAIANDTKGVLAMPFPPELQNRLMDHELGFIPTLIVPRTRLIGIIDSVRKVVLEWSLKLESEGILGEGMSFSAEEKQKAASQHFQITNFTGVIGNVQGEQVQIGDFNSILPKLKQLGISQQERNELENILDELKSTKPAKKENILARGMDWVLKNADKLGALSDTIRGWFEIYNKSQP